MRTGDRLTNQVAVTRVRNKDVFRSEFTEYRTLRESEIANRGTLPARLLNIYYERELPKLSFGGRTFASISSSSPHPTVRRKARKKVTAGTSTASVRPVEWLRSLTFSSGLIARAELGMPREMHTRLPRTASSKAISRA